MKYVVHMAVDGVLDLEVEAENPDAAYAEALADFDGGPASEERWVGKDGRLRPAFCPPVTPGEEKGGWRICWKIGRQTHNNILQCDYDIDFEMPYVTAEMAKADPELVEGDVDDTNGDVVLKWGKVLTKGRNGHIDSMRLGAPVGYRSWEDFAKYVRRIARRVWRDWKDNDD